MSSTMRPTAFTVLALALVFAATAPLRAQPLFAPTVISNTAHSGSVGSVAFSPNGNWLASASSDTTIKLWDVASGRLLRTLVGHADNVSSVAISADGRSIVSSSHDKTIRLWDAESGRTLRSWTGDSSRVASVAFSPDGLLIASGGWDSSVKLWEAASGRLVRAFPSKDIDFVNSVAFSPNGAQIFAGTYNGNLKLFDIASGRTVRAIRGHSTQTNSIAFSKDGSSMVSGGDDGTVKIWNATSGRLLHTLKHSDKFLQAVAFSPDGRVVGSAGGYSGVKLWDVSNGRLIRTVDAETWSWALAFSSDGSLIASGNHQHATFITLIDAVKGTILPTSFGGRLWPVNALATSDDRWVVVGPNGLTEWNGSTGQLTRVHETDPGESGNVISFGAKNSKGQSLVATLHSDTIRVWDVTNSAKLLHTFERGPARKCKDCPNEPGLSQVTLSQDGRWLAANLLFADPSVIKIWDVASGLLRHDLPTLAPETRAGWRLAFAPDGRWLASQSYNTGKGGYLIRLWDPENGALLKTFELPHGQPIGCAGGGEGFSVSPDARFLTTNLRGWTDKDYCSLEGVALFDASSGKMVRSFTSDKINNAPFRITFSPDGRLLVVGVASSEAINIWETESGRFVRTLEGNPGSWGSLAFSPSGKRLIVGNRNATSSVWNVQTGTLLAITLHSRSAEWITITPEGFFASSSSRAGDALSVVHGFTVYTVDQIYQALFNPDLVREKLADDPNGEVKKAASVLDLAKVLGSGQAPRVTITSTGAGSASGEEVVNAEARVADQGGGIGRIEWRLNGVTVGVTHSAPGDGKERVVRRTLALEPGENALEVVAYNAANLLASRAGSASITYSGPADAVRPNLHVLAIGIDAYTDTGWVPPGAADAVVFPKLSLAVKDATTFASDLRKAAAGRYQEVRVTLALDGDATVDGLERTIDRLAGEVHPRDTLVLFAAAHGYSENGRFYLIPQDYQGGPDSLVQRAIGQDRLQDWIVNRLRAKKAVILLDTCESGALVGGHTQSRTEIPASEAGVGRLHEATGRPILTAAASGRPAFEGYKGHGVFTWALLDALRSGDRNANGIIELSELVAHVQDLVPKLSAELNGTGRAAIAVRGLTDDRQSARFGSRGEDFALAGRLQ